MDMKCVDQISIFQVPRSACGSFSSMPAFRLEACPFNPKLTAQCSTRIADARIKRLRASYGDKNSLAVSREKAISSSTLVEERIGSKLVQSYFLDDKYSEVKRLKDNFQAEKPTRDFNLARVTIDFILPAGFPGSVSKDYFRYMLWQLPTNITAWICRALITSSLLQAVGISAGPGPTAAATAAIKWVTKDGLGAIGRLFVGGRFGGVFDEDPKQWRMYAELVGSFGGVFELVTPLAPDYFLPLASLGHLTKAIAKGLKDPSFRVIQNHFALSENVGDVAAKEEVWEVAGQLIGLSLGVALLSTPVVATSYGQLAFSWALIRSFHLWLRYQSLAVLELPTLNYKRMTILITEHVQGIPLSSVAECNKKESLIMPRQSLKPTIHIGCYFQDILRPQASASEVKEILDLYKSEKYVLSIDKNPFSRYEVRVLLKEGSTSVTILRSMYQAYFLFQSNQSDFEVPMHTMLMKSLNSMQHSFSSFTDELDKAGWNLNQIVLKVPNAAPIYSFKTNFPSDDQLNIPSE